MSRPQYDVDVSDTHRWPSLNSPVALIVPLGIGITLICSGSVVAEEWLAVGLAVLIVGVIILGASFIGAHRLAVLILPEEATGFALLIMVEFLAGAFLAFVGFSNVVFEANGDDRSLIAVAALGLVLVSDSLILYCRGFKRSAGENKVD